MVITYNSELSMSLGRNDVAKELLSFDCSLGSDGGACGARARLWRSAAWQRRAPIVSMGIDRPPMLGGSRHTCQGG